MIFGKDFSAMNFDLLLTDQKGIRYRSYTRFGKRTTFRLEMVNHICDNIAQVAVHLQGVIAVNLRNQIRALADIHAIHL